jgi:hypothetical protein
MIGRETSIPHNPRDSQSPKNLHRARCDMIAFHAWDLTGRIAFGDHDIDAARREVQRQG